VTAALHVPEPLVIAADEALDHGRPVVVVVALKSGAEPSPVVVVPDVHEVEGHANGLGELPATFTMRRPADGRYVRLYRAPNAAATEEADDRPT
jgi:hypothetical protein